MLDDLDSDGDVGVGEGMEIDKWQAKGAFWRELGAVAGSEGNRNCKKGGRHEGDCVTWRMR